MPARMARLAAARAGVFSDGLDKRRRYQYYHFQMRRPSLSYILPVTMLAKSKMAHTRMATKIGIPMMTQTVIQATTLSTIMVTPLPTFPM